MNPSANIHLVALFEIVTRFSVPIFFFISAFGLFYNLDMDKPFDYESFMRRRFKTVLIPYLTWSVFYIIHDNWYYGYGIPALDYFIKILFFGLAKYQLYFLVILLWFYALMPLWIKMIKKMTQTRLILLLIIQTAFNYFSSYNMTLTMFTYSLPEDSLLRWFLMFRLNYLILHYVFIFVIGGYLAVNIDKFFDFMRRNKIAISLSFILSLIAMLCHYYFLIFVSHITPEAAVNTAHQLSPIGIIYTITASIFFFMLFMFVIPNSQLLNVLGKHSYFAYLFHPFVITYLGVLLNFSGRIMTAPIAIVFYVITVIISIKVAAKFRELGEKYPLLNKLTIGIYPKNN